MSDPIEEAIGPEGHRYLVVDPMDNILIGSERICRYLHISSIVTMYQWVELYGLPAIKRPDGQWMSSCTSIDQWMFLGAELDNENRANSRGYSARAEIMKRRIDVRLEAQKRGVTAHDQNSVGVALEIARRKERTAKKPIDPRSPRARAAAGENKDA